MNSLKSYIVLIFVSLTLLTSAKSNHIHYFTNKVDNFLKKYVHNGNVNYKVIKENRLDLQDLIKMIEDIDLRDADKELLLPFYINVYNVLTINQIVDNYPVNSVMDIEDFFESKFVVGRKRMTLNELEQKYIFESYENKMVHFALVCAAKDCPQLISEAYTLENLDMLLEQNAINFLNNSNNYNLEGETVKVSSIFDWYQNDFGGIDGVKQFINTYAEQKFNESAEIEFINYNWSLNELTAAGR